MLTHADDHTFRDLSALKGVKIVEVSDDNTGFTVIPVNSDHSGELFSAVNQLVASQGWPVKELYIESGRLDDVFRQLTLGERAEDTVAMKEVVQ